MKKLLFLVVAFTAFYCSSVHSIALGRSTSFSLLKSSTGWFAAGSKPRSYEMGVTTDEHHSGKSCAFIRSKEDSIQGFGTYMQEILPGEYLNKSIKFSAYIKTKNVKGWVGLWMRTDGPKQTLSFDNMHNRPISGTTDWQKYEIILDVPKNAKDIAFGVLENSTGEVFFDDVQFEILGPPQGNLGTVGSEALKQPINLDFEQ